MTFVRSPSVLCRGNLAAIGFLASVRPGPLTETESADSLRIILVGHSAGGWAALKVARDLRDKGIPIELTVQLDSVGVTDRTVPRDVKAIAVFRAHGILRPVTTKNIRMEDPQHTSLIADVVVKNGSHISMTVS